MGILCLIPKITHILSEYAILIAFRFNISFMNAPQNYVIRKLPVLYSLVFCVIDLIPTLVICYPHWGYLIFKKTTAFPILMGDIRLCFVNY